MRISVTDRCNLRCAYCMPEGGIFCSPQAEILSFEEIVRLTQIFASLGGRILRLTGGDPLVRKGIVNLVERLSKIQGIEEVCLTTNGVFLPWYADDLKRAGLHRINVSLDTLKARRFQQITGYNRLFDVLEGIKKITSLGFRFTKLNVVIMKGINDDEIIDFMHFALREGLILRFIEFMKITPLWDERFFMPIEAVRDICHREFGLHKTDYRSPGPAEYYQYADGIVGFIKTSQASCSRCSRLRITSTGEAKVCLYQPQGISLRDLLRRGEPDEQIRSTMKVLMALKNNIDYSKWEKSEIYMCSVGG